MPYLRCLCLFLYSGVQHIVLCFCFYISSSCVSYVASFSGLPIFDCHWSSLTFIYNYGTFVIWFLSTNAKTACHILKTLKKEPRFLIQKYRCHFHLFVFLNCFYIVQWLLLIFYGAIYSIISMPTWDCDPIYKLTRSC